MPFLYLTRGVKVDTRGINAPIDSIQTKDQISREKKSIYEQKWIQQV